jgi:hypothetical protein
MFRIFYFFLCRLVISGRRRRGQRRGVGAVEEEGTVGWGGGVD